MLPTDWALMYDTQINPATYYMSCSPQGGDEPDNSELPPCRRHEDAHEIIQNFAHDYDAWMDAFTAAYQKMQRNGCPNCVPV